jgi:hypothetical protein
MRLIRNIAVGRLDGNPDCEIAQALKAGALQKVMA